MKPVMQIKRIKSNPKILVAMIIVTLFTALGMFMMTQGIDYTQQPGMDVMDENELMIMTTIANDTVVIIGVFTTVFYVFFFYSFFFAVAIIVNCLFTFYYYFSQCIFIIYILIVCYLLI